MSRFQVLARTIIFATIAVTAGDPLFAQSATEIPAPAQAEDQEKENTDQTPFCYTRKIKMTGAIKDLIQALFPDAKLKGKKIFSLTICYPAKEDD